MPTLAEIRAAPKVLLHDHLDGGLRAATVVDLARNIGYDRLPSDNMDEVAVWLQRGANRGHLNLYLDAFQHTLAVMQTREALIRVAAECAEDLAADGVVYAEVRFAPELHVAGGLSLDEVVEAVLEGFRAGSAGRGITIYALLTAMRTAARSLEIAELAVRYRDRGVAGFDIAGAEAPEDRLDHLVEGEPVRHVQLWREPDLGVDHPVRREVFRALGRHPDQGVAGLHDRHRVLEGVEVKVQVTPVGAALQPQLHLGHVVRGEPVVADLPGEVHDRGCPQPSVEMIVKQLFGSSADLVQTGHLPILTPCRYCCYPPM